jgi:hypothetical protein
LQVDKECRCPHIKEDVKCCNRINIIIDYPCGTSQGVTTSQVTDKPETIEKHNPDTAKDEKTSYQQ